ncbi:hypothetical protein EVAR_39704_1 [Eumeta japonica]|uniref:Uncharacterized protein n=1 Tax=Eumeta variegata TaxID=151549 RepID=A0A4C1W873_EUMVA|nr:hypothetical protein EVAR_39704_1 [Eumeta japonica]
MQCGAFASKCLFWYGFGISKRNHRGERSWIRKTTGGSAVQRTGRAGREREIRSRPAGGQRGDGTHSRVRVINNSRQLYDLRDLRVRPQLVGFSAARCAASTF